MPNVSSHNEPNKSDAKNTGHGALGMGGDPSDDPRDIAAGGEGRTNNDLGGKTGPVGGAFGGASGVGTGGGSAGNETVGPMGDKGITGNIGGTATDKPRGQGRPEKS